MSAKVILIFYAQVVLIQSTLRNCPSLTAVKNAPIISASYGAAMTSPCHRGYPALSSSAIEITPTSGGLLPVTSASAFSPELKLVSENEYEGTLSVAGELPFIGTVGLEGMVPSAGTGIVKHACGNGPARIISTNLEPLSNSAITHAANKFATSAVGIVPEAYSSGFDYKNVMEYYRSSQFGYFGVNDNAYSDIGKGKVAVTGQLPVVGDTVVAGQIPIMGAVNYCGAVPACGSVSISGLCNCNGPYW